MPTGFDPVAVEAFSVDEECIPPSLGHRKVRAVRGFKFGREEDAKGVPVTVFG